MKTTEIARPASGAITATNAKSEVIGREGLLGMISATVAACGGGRITLDRFLALSSLRKRDISHHFSTWQDALRAAGCSGRPRNAPVGTTALLEDWGAVAAKLRRAPTVRDYIVHGAHTEGTFSSRFGSWSRVPAAFRAHAARKPRWKRVLKQIVRTPRASRRTCPGIEQRRRTCPGVVLSEVEREKPDSRTRRSSPGTTPRKSPCRPPHSTPAPRLPGRPASGDQLGLPGMRNAPVNEQGVVYLFGLLAPRLGFDAEAFQAAYPDCEARRQIAPGKWQSIRIEVEYESKNFLLHGHDPAGCDLIVCWEHNWKECPKSLEVIALSEYISHSP